MDDTMPRREPDAALDAPHTTPAGTDPADRADLARAAQEARSAGQPARAAEAWRALLRRFPEDWRAALELERDMAAGGRYAESDPLFRRAARHLPDEAWLAHYTALYAFHQPDLDALDARARDILARRPGDATVYALLGDIARQRRDFAAAEAWYTRAAALDPARAEYAAGSRAARRYRHLSRRLPDWPAEGGEYAVAVLNLDRNTERRVEMERRFQDAPVPVFRVPGVEGGRLPLAAVGRLTGGEAGAGQRGTLGCFLGHAAAWEEVVRRGLAHCLIVEDDVIPLLPLPPRLGPLGLPAGWDVCFVNDRMAPPDGEGSDGEGDEEGFRTVALARAVRGFAPDHNAPGADGYLVSAAGAHKLLEWVARDGFAGDVDWRLLAYGLTPDEVASLPRAGHAWGVLDAMARRVGRAERLRAHVLCPALIRTVPVSSDREDENRAV